MNNFYTVTRTSNGISQIPIDSKLFESRNIYIEGEINSESAILAVKQIHLLNLEDSVKPINLFINSFGGEIISGMLIYDAIQDSLCPVNTVCLGNAYSMGAVLVASGTGKRYILPHSKLMLHEPLIPTNGGGSASSIKELSESMQKTKGAMNEILAKHTGKPIEEVEKATDHDHFYTAEEAFEFGLVDEITGLSEFLRRA